MGLSNHCAGSSKVFCTSGGVVARIGFTVVGLGWILRLQDGMQSLAY